MTARISAPFAWLTLAVSVMFAVSTIAAGSDAESGAWQRIERSARGETVYFNAWAGDEAINRYLAWAGGELSRRYGVTLVHVKLADTSEAVSRILAEQTAGRTRDGSVDLIWINGENFASLRNAKLLWGPWTASLPNARLIDTTGNPTTITDMSLPTAGYELAWGTARFTLIYESAAVPTPPRDPVALLAWIRHHPGRFSYPQPPNFLGTSFLKQMLLLLSPEASRVRFAAPVGEDFDSLTQPLWNWLDQAHPFMWRGGKIFPASGPAQRRLLGDGEVDFAMAFNPAEASRAIRRGELPGTTRAAFFAGGALANSHFLAIPFNVRAKDGAMVTANFLLSPEAQARKADEAEWGDPTVLAVFRLAANEQARFAALHSGAATPVADGPIFAEPHATWMGALERAWTRRYGLR